MSRKLIGYHFACSGHWEKMWSMKEVKEIINELRRLEQVKFGKAPSVESIKTKLKNHISAKNTKRNEKLGTRAGTRKRKQIIENVDEENPLSEDVEEDEPRVLTEGEALLNQMEEDLESQIDSQNIRTASQFKDFRTEEKDRVEERNRKIRSKRLEKEEMVERVRAREERKWMIFVQL